LAFRAKSDRCGACAIFSGILAGLGHLGVNPNRIDDATVKQTAKAYLKVRQIVQEANQDLNNTTDKTQQQQIAKQAESRKMDAVKAEGLQPQQYNEVVQLARVDKSFQQKFFSYINEVKNSSG
jgi:Domain of unknown function (DUF4168)